MKSLRKTILFLSFLLLPITLNFFSPYMIMDGLAHKLIVGSFVVWGLMFITSLFIGRAFCSYVCPYGGLQLVADAVMQKPLKEKPLLRKLKPVLGVLWLLLIVILIIMNIGSLSFNILYNTENLVSVDNIQMLMLYYFIVLGLLILPLIFGKRASCYYFCPMSILNISGTKIKNKLNLPSLRLISDSSKCTGCKACNKNCPMSLKVNEMVKNSDINNRECILCGECGKSCKTGAIKRIYGRDNTNIKVKVNKDTTI